MCIKMDAIQFSPLERQSIFVLVRVPTKRRYKIITKSNSQKKGQTFKGNNIFKKFF